MESEGHDDSDRSGSSDSSDVEESQSESNDEKSDNEADQEGIIESLQNHVLIVKVGTCPRLQ